MNFNATENLENNLPLCDLSGLCPIEGMVWMSFRQTTSHSQCQVMEGAAAKSISIEPVFQKRCLDNWACQFYSFDQTSATCYLHSSCTSITNKECRGHCVTGQKGCKSGSTALAPNCARDVMTKFF